MRPEAATHRAVLAGALAGALAAGRCPKPGPTATFLLECVKSGNNPALVSLRAGPGRIPASTLSERLGKVDLKVFLRRLGERLERQALDALRRWRPTRGELYALLDGHEEEYWPKAGRHRCDPKKCRNRYAHGTYGHNKRSLYSHRWLFMGLTWKHGNEWITLPLRLDLLGPLETSPYDQVEQFALLLRRLGLRPRALLVDRGYDSWRVRRVAARHRLPLGLRVSFGYSNRSPRHAILEQNGEPMTIQHLLEETAKDGTIRIDAWRDSRTGVRIAQRARTVRVRFRPGEPAVDLTVIATLKPQPGFAPRWKVDLEHSMAPSFPPGTSTRDAQRRYRVRWNVETTFNQWSQDRPQPRSKTIQAHAILFCAYAFRMCLGALVRLAVRLAALVATGAYGAAARITTRVASRWVLDPD